jgi:hypothetical protein
MGSLKRTTSATENWILVSQKLCRTLNISDFISPDLLQDYLDEGWGKITKNYKKGSIGKERNQGVEYVFDGLEQSQKKLVLEILGSIRKYQIQTIFECVGKLKDNEYFAAGSNNITSDYDVSIVGPDSNDIMWKMFTVFLDKYKKELPHAFDSNLYSSPLYIYKNKDGETFDRGNIRKIGEGFPGVKYGARNITLVPATIEDLKEELTWAGVKLLKPQNLESGKKFVLIDHIDKKYKYVHALISTYSWLYKQKMDDICMHSINDENNIELKKMLDSHLDWSIETRSIVRNYYLQYQAQKICSDFIYENKPLQTYIKIANKLKNNIFFYSNVANYFSSEAYYTSSAVNTIVVEKQLKKQLPKEGRSEEIVKGIYLTSALENFADMINHMKHEKGDLKKSIIKYSKYLYRIYFSLGETGNVQARESAKLIEENIIPYRKTYNIDKADMNKVWGYVLYDGGSKEDYILKIINKISEIFNNYLSEMPEIKKWLEGSVVPDVRDMKRGGKGTRRMKRKMKNKTRKC